MTTPLEFAARRRAIRYGLWLKFCEDRRESERLRLLGELSRKGQRMPSDAPEHAQDEGKAAGEG